MLTDLSILTKNCYNYIMEKPRLSPQAQRIYRLLLEKSVMDAGEVGKALGVFPQAVYREARQLQALGLVEETSRWPVRFRARSTMDGIHFYLQKEREWFFEAFGGGSKSDNRRQTDGLGISFIQTRQESYERFTKDLATAQKTARLLVSGLEVPAEQMLCYKQAVDRGVEIKILVQQEGLTKKEMLRNWQTLGVLVRSIQTIDVRILTIDERICYLLSYDPHKSHQAIGIRFAYPPIAFLLSELFQKRWKIANKV